MPSMSRLGRNQKEILGHMHRNSGAWPQNWRIHSSTRRTLDSLIRRGLVVCDGDTYRTVKP